MNARKSRVARKAERVEKTALDRVFDAELGALRRDRDEANRAANAERDTAIAKAQRDCIDAKKEADKRYEAERAKLLKRLAAKEPA